MSGVQKITLSASRDIPFSKLVLSQSNVRRIKAGLSVDELAEDIARRGLLQSLNVRPVLDGEGAETGMYEIPAGGRRYRALQLLVKQKRLAKTASVPCVVRGPNADVSAEEDSLAENFQRAALHPLDQFRAFQTLRDQGASEEEIAARFFVSSAVVKQRLRLAAVSEKLLAIYADDGMTLDQLTAFAVTPDHARQEQVWEAIQHSYNKEPYFIRRQLTEGAVRASDRRAQFVGLDAYEAAGGRLLRDLFEDDDGGWLQDPALLDRLAIDKLKAEAEALRAEGWKWIAVAIDFPHGHTAGLRLLPGRVVLLGEEEHATRQALREELERLEAEYAEADELPDAIDQRMAEIETALEAFEDRPRAYNASEVAYAGAFVSIDGEGRLRVERGFVKPEDEPAVLAADGVAAERDERPGEPASVPRTVITVGGAPTDDGETEDDAQRPLPERLVTELTAHRTLALRDAMAKAPDTAFLAVLHALCLNSFYRFSSDSCLEITAKHSTFAAQAPGLADTLSAKAIEARQTQWEQKMPEAPVNLWDALTALDMASRAALFAHCAALTINVVKEPWNRRPGALAHGEHLALTIGLDMAAAGWRPTVDSYLGRVPKARILEAVREAKGEPAAQLIDHLKKAEMAKEAERLLENTGWLPEPLRPALGDDEQGVEGESTENRALPAFLAEDDDDMAEENGSADAPVVTAE